jgi:isopenicillin N synthase-like dioxygenase
MFGKIIIATLAMTSCLMSLDIRIPVVDMQDFYNPEKQEQFLSTMYDAMTDIGFFAVRNTGVNGEVIKTAYAQAETFFKSDPTFKATCYLKELNGQRGFVPGERAKGESAKDCKEFYHIGRERNIWPAQEGFKEALTTLYSELEKYAIPLQEAIILTINRKIPLDFFHQMTKEGDSLLRALYYPALSESQFSQPNSPLFWAAAHTDIDLLTILPFATAQGLQVFVHGEWLNVTVPDDAFIINVGDMLENLSNGLFKSARHRVLAQNPDQDRFSMVFFLHPTPHSEIGPLPECIELTGGVQRYAPGTRDEFLWERLLELNIAPALLEPYAKTGHTQRQMLYGRESPQVVQLLSENNLIELK